MDMMPKRNQLLFARQILLAFPAMRMKQIHAIALLTTLLVGCREMQPISSHGAKKMVRTELFFGRSMPAGGEVSDAQWQAFVDEVVTPRFPDGFTIIDALGQYRETSGKIDHEPSKILLIFHKPDEATMKKVDEIREAYKKQFGQESVIRESGRVWVAF
jgi:hypothetical protein